MPCCNAMAVSRDTGCHALTARSGTFKTACCTKRDAACVSGRLPMARAAHGAPAMAVKAATALAAAAMNCRLLTSSAALLCTACGSSTGEKRAAAAADDASLLKLAAQRCTRGVVCARLRTRKQYNVDTRGHDNVQYEGIVQRRKYLAKYAANPMRNSAAQLQLRSQDQACSAALPLHVRQQSHAVQSGAGTSAESCSNSVSLTSVAQSSSLHACAMVVRRLLRCPPQPGALKSLSSCSLASVQCE
jgi:hypothetical protein